MVFNFFSKTPSNDDFKQYWISFIGGGGAGASSPDYGGGDYDYNYAYDDYGEQGRTSQGYLQGYDYGDRPYYDTGSSRGSSHDYNDFQAYDPVNYYSNLHSRGEDAYVGNGNGYRGDYPNEDFYYK